MHIREQADHLLYILIGVCQQTEINSHKNCSIKSRSFQDPDELLLDCPPWDKGGFRRLGPSLVIALLELRDSHVLNEES